MRRVWVVMVNVILVPNNSQCVSGSRFLLEATRLIRRASNATVAISVFENSRQAREFGFECRCRRLVMMPSVVETTLRVSRKSDLVVLAK
jgi:hypothetical protein